MQDLTAVSISLVDKRSRRLLKHFALQKIDLHKLFNVKFKCRPNSMSLPVVVVSYCARLESGGVKPRMQHRGKVKFADGNQWDGVIFTCSRRSLRFVTQGGVDLVA